MIYIGIDTGAHTGVAVWSSARKEFLAIRTMKIHEALDFVRGFTQNPNALKVYFEDARQRKWIPNSGDPRTEAGRRQGAGSIKRDSTIWEDALKDWGITYEAIPPKRNRTKLNAEAFKALTHYKGQTSEHARDAAMLVYGRN